MSDLDRALLLWVLCGLIDLAIEWQRDLRWTRQMWSDICATSPVFADCPLWAPVAIVLVFDVLLGPISLVLTLKRRRRLFRK